MWSVLSTCKTTGCDLDYQHIRQQDVILCHQQKTVCVIVKSTHKTQVVICTNTLDCTSDAQDTGCDQYYQHTRHDQYYQHTRHMMWSVQVMHKTQDVICTPSTQDVICTSDTQDTGCDQYYQHTRCDPTTKKQDRVVICTYPTASHSPVGQ